MGFIKGCIRSGKRRSWLCGTAPGTWLNESLLVGCCLSRCPLQPHMHLIGDPFLSLPLPPNPALTPGLRASFHLHYAECLSAGQLVLCWGIIKNLISTNWCLSRRQDGGEKWVVALKNNYSRSLHCTIHSYLTNVKLLFEIQSQTHRRIHLVSEKFNDPRFSFIGIHTNDYFFSLGIPSCLLPDQR